MSTEKMGISDSVVAILGKAKHKDWSRRIGEKVRMFDGISMRTPRLKRTEKVGMRANVHVVLTGPDGAIKYDEWGENLVTDVGDGSIAERLYDDTGLIVTGMKLGTGVAVVAKNGAGSGLGTYITGSDEPLDASATDATKGAGLGWRTTYVTTWPAGNVTNGAISEVALTDQTTLADNTSLEADTWARFVFGATIDKQAGDSLEVTWQIDILGA